MKKAILNAFLSALLFTANLSPAVIAEEVYTESQHEMKLNGETIWSKRYNVSGQTYVNIRDIAHIYDKFVISGGENVIVISERVPETELTVFAEYDYLGIPSYYLEDIAKKLREKGDERRVSYSRFEWIHEHHQKEIGYTPCFFGNYYAKLADTCIFWSRELEPVSNDVNRVYIPVEVFKKFNVRLFIDELDITSETVKILVDDSEYNFPCISNDKEVYVSIRNLAEIFGFSVGFNNNIIELIDGKMETEELPEGINIYIINGVKFLWHNEIAEPLAARGYSCGLEPFSSSRWWTKMPGYYIEIMERKGIYEEGISAPFFNYSDTVEEARVREKIMIMYEYFANRDLL